MNVQLFTRVGVSNISLLRISVNRAMFLNAIVMTGNYYYIHTCIHFLMMTYYSYAMYLNSSMYVYASMCMYVLVQVRFLN